MLRTSETYLNSLRAGTIHRECASLETRICTGFDSGILSRPSLSFALQKRPALRLLALTLAEKAENESRCYPHFVLYTCECNCSNSCISELLKKDGIPPSNMLFSGNWKHSRSVLFESSGESSEVEAHVGNTLRYEEQSGNSRDSHSPPSQPG